MARRKIVVQGLGTIEADQVGFRDNAEYWNEYLLDDGTTVRIKLIVGGVYRVPDQYDAEGNPMYVVNTNQVTRIDAPDHLRRDPS